MSGITSASGLLSLLDEHEEDKLKVYALEKLNVVVDQFWAEIADNIQQIEVLNENEAFEARELAALVASKVYYHIGSFKSAMIYALAAGKLFDINEDSFYARTLVSKCIDEYIRQRTEGKESQEHEVPTEGLEKIVDAVFDHSYVNGEYKYALGIAIETKRLDRLEETIKRSGQAADLLDYTYRVCMDAVVSRDLRQTVFGILVRLYRELGLPNWTRMCEILIFLDDASSVAQILCTLLKSEEHFLIAYQIAFDLCKNASQQFRMDVKKEVVAKMEVDTEQSKIQEYYAQLLQETEEKERRRLAGEAMEVETKPQETAAPEKKDDTDPKVTGARLANMKAILSGQTSTSLFLEFLHRNNHSDKLILHNIKTAMDSKSSIVFSSILICHGFMNCGTTNDFFLRENMDWLSKATNWSKFTATASLGVIQQGHIKESLSLLAPYLPQQGALSSPYSEGGALYALGLIHANHGDEITDYLRTALTNAGTNEIVQHGACLGLGVAAMATRDLDIFEDLKSKVLFTDSAVGGEAAGLAMGLVMLGSASDKALEDMLTYAHDTQHEKIIRGLAVGIALIMAGRQEEADTLIQTMVLDKDPILRYGGMYTIALAYCGTSNDAAIRRLLHVAVSDVSNDVRRAAVLALGFVLLNQPDQCPKLVNLLAESYNPHVRYGAALAVGISCAGTGLKSAVDLLEPLAGDHTDFVRQGALIALGMVLAQTSKAQEPRVEKARKLLADTIADKHEDIMAKFGACLATGIIDGGGRNCSISPRSTSGHIDTTAIIGLALFTQYWYWHPLAHFLSLSFTPTAVIGLNKDLKMPVWKFRSNAKPSLFAYPPKVKPPVAKTVKKLETAELSITKKAKIRQRQKDKEKNEREGGPAEAMEVDPKKEEPKEDKMDVDKDKEGAEKEKEKEAEKKEEEVPEPDFEILNNPARVTVRQLERLAFDPDERYVPVQPSSIFGIVVLKDKTPDMEEVFVTPAAPPTEVEDDGDEPEPPQPFDYDPAKEKD